MYIFMIKFNSYLQLFAHNYDLMDFCTESSKL